MNAATPRMLATAHPQVVSQLEQLLVLPKLRTLPFGSWALRGQDSNQGFLSIIIYELNMTIELTPLWSQEFNCVRWIKFHEDPLQNKPPLLTTMAHVTRYKEVVIVLPAQAFSFEALLLKVNVAIAERGIHAT